LIVQLQTITTTTKNLLHNMLLIYLFIYLFLGAMYELFMDWVITILERENEEDLSHLRFNNLEKFTNLILWPYYLIVFIVGIFKDEEE
jgi:peptidoglycan biosynthesis protein MviN/MurJ (putative lipid II flippase)